MNNYFVRNKHVVVPELKREVKMFEAIIISESKPDINCLIMKL